MSSEGFFAASPERFSFIVKDEKGRSNPSGELLAFYDDLKEESFSSRVEVVNMENDLRSSLSNKCKSSERYSQNLYAALCNNSFLKGGQEWGCSWRHAGGIIADLREQGDYLDWYCSGIKAEQGFVEEGHVTEEVRADLSSIGWSYI